MRHFEEAGSSKPSLNIKKQPKTAFLSISQIAPVKNQPQLFVQPFSRAHFGPMCNFPARQNFFFFFFEIFAGVNVDQNQIDTDLLMHFNHLRTCETHNAKVADIISYNIC